jgi:magnesium-transporting ATPase (P-type)
MSEPLFLFQYALLLNWFLHRLYWQTLMMATFLFIVVTINYVFLYLNFKKIKDMAEKDFSVKVIRDCIVQEISCALLVPGDLFIVGKRIPCDSILVSGG